MTTGVSLDLTSMLPALKEHYTSQTVENMVYQNNPFLAMLPKYEKFGGKNLPIPIIYGNPQGRSATFSRAQGNRTASKLKEFFLTRVKDYGVATIDNETLLASVGSANAFLEAATLEIDGAIQAVTNSMAHASFRSGSGSLGQIGSISTDTITLSNINDVVFFEVGMTVVASTADGGGTVKNTSGTENALEVIAVDRDLGTVKFSATVLFGTQPWAVNDYLFVQGDYDSKLSGLGAWLPATAPTSGDSFFQVDRSADATRLAGVRGDISGLPLEEGLIKSINRIFREGGDPDYVWLNHDNYTVLENALGSKVQYADVMSQYAGIGFRGIVLHGANGKAVKVLADRNCPDDRTFVTTMKGWKLYSLGKPVDILDTDGNRWLRQTSDDGVEIRVGGYFNLGCNSPGYNGNFKIK